MLKLDKKCVSFYGILGEVTFDNFMMTLIIV